MTSQSPPAGAGQPSSPTTVEVGETWRRLHPLSPVVRFGRVLIGVLVIAVPSIADSQGLHHDGGFPVSLVVYLGLLGLGGLGGGLSWRVTSWGVAAGGPQVTRG